MVLDTEALLAPLLGCCGPGALTLQVRTARRRTAVSHTVLVCDDAIFMRTMIRDILAQAGFEVVGEAETGRRRWRSTGSSSPTSSRWTS